MIQADDLYVMMFIALSGVRLVCWYLRWLNIFGRSVVKHYYAKAIHCSGVTALYTCLSEQKTCHRVVYTSFWWISQQTELCYKICSSRDLRQCSF